MIDNLSKLVIQNGGSIKPLIIPSSPTQGRGLCNPTILVDENDVIRVNVRNVQYILHHNEGQQKYQNSWSGPLQYLNPEDDLTLTTNNFLCVLDNETLDIKTWNRVDTSKLDVKPLWEFVGLEDARLMRWDNKLYMCGVRRDTTTNGEGRMEFSTIVDNKEVDRRRIDAPPADHYLYCEKNWVPILDMPYHFMKWSNPVEIVKVDIETKTSEIVITKPAYKGVHTNLRGGSQIIQFGDYRISVTHEVYFPGNPQKHKDAHYLHRFIVWDKDWNVVTVSDEFNFLSGRIEFSCGMALYKENILVTFGFQDNAAYILKIPIEFFKNFVGLSDTFKNFNWGQVNDNGWFLNKLREELVFSNIYNKFLEINEGDIVVDIGASVGPFTKSILKYKPKAVYCLEPQKNLFKTLTSNLSKEENVICINKGIIDVEGESMFTGIYDSAGYHEHKKAEGTKFSTFISDNGIEKIDFLKLDCEGGEYDIFTEENKNWILKNVKKISGEFHLRDKELKTKFRKFRDTYLNVFANYKIRSIDDIDIEWDLWNDHFIDYYCEIMIHIDNTKNDFKILPTIQIDDVKNDFKILPTIQIDKNQNKLENFPSVYWITLEDSANRQKMMMDQISRFGIKTHKMIKAYDGRIINYNNNPIVFGSFLHMLDSGSVATSMSHLKAIEDWYNNTNESYGFFCEDDILLTNSDNWTFTWVELMNRLPKNWKAVQLSLIRDSKKESSYKFTDDMIKFRQREWYDFGASAYIITREHAKFIIDSYIQKDKFNLNIEPAVYELHPFAKNIIYIMNNPDTYTLPIFTENVSIPSTFYPLFIQDEYKSSQQESSEYVQNWWKRHSEVDQLSILFNKIYEKDYWKTTNYPTLEITTTVPPKGCVINCASCPQTTLTTAYNGSISMTLSQFKEIIDKLPKEIRIAFSGFSEPWLNNKATDMLIYAHEEGHPVSVFTTGIGMSIDDIDRIKDIPFDKGPNGGFCLHLPDQEKISKHPINKRYIEVLEHFKKVQNKIQGFYVMSLGTVSDDVKHIFSTGNYPNIHSRAGNLISGSTPDFDKVKNKVIYAPHRKEPSTCGIEEKLYHNVVLPDGNVYLCCMDYGLNEPLGNLYEQNYEDIIPEPNKCFNLCQKCENGVSPK